MEYFIRAVNKQFQKEVHRYPTVPGLAEQEIAHVIDA
jgi:hypothetical protein